ncbi:hypothetical protein J4N02_04005 [Propioniciclava sp. MC1595]|uniref:hypothetical protein n=1 Tax=unclassified Propioniciclava TaxID=2642922 RepID=UPI0015FFCC24|nr:MULTISPECIES: hypothetical protein [unclassified Propioniciclava]MBB1496073.1 hypothetical protein [Propioniciclava sp. MC1595]MBB1499900.1 hypothetical protein [Propioniciclava sp. MC1683]QTE26779.1 hypothetical protein J4N02_04005 [Propioniciclava sp. MC1595]
MSGTAASTKVWRRIGVHAREALLRTLNPIELRTILADVARSRASDQTPADLIKRWREDKLLAPSMLDPREALPITAKLWEVVPPEFVGVTLSQLTSLGSGIHLGGLGQNRVVTTMRGTEVLADPKHGLALEASRRRRNGHSRVHLATHARCTHAWDHSEESSHELRFALVSSAPDGGGLSTEADLLDLHLDYWREIMGTVVPRGRIELTVWDSTLAGLIEARGTRDGVIVVEGTSDERRPWRNPYTTAAFRFVVDGDGDEPHEVGDGGFVTWTQALTRNRKDRCLVSGVSVDAIVPHTWEQSE